MSVKILIGDVREQLKTLPDESVHCVVTSPPYWGLRSYLVDDDPQKPLEIGLEPTLGRHIDTLIGVFREIRRVLHPMATVWLNYGDCYATSPNGRSAAATRAAGNDDRTFRDKPFSTIGPILGCSKADAARARVGSKSAWRTDAGYRACAGGYLKPKDLCMIPNRLAIALQDDGWWVRSEIIWGKNNPMPDSSGKYRPSTAHEKIFMLSKSAKCFYDAEAVALPWRPSTHVRLAQPVEQQIGNEQTRYLRNYEPTPVVVWEMATQPSRLPHFATFPPKLAERCILAGCPENGTVLDCFGGTGTTGLIADRLQRNAVLIELNPQYAAMAEERIRGDAPMFTQLDIAAG